MFDAIALFKPATVTSPAFPDLGVLGAFAIAIPGDVALYNWLTLASGIFWTITYILLIFRGFKDKTCGMPLFVLGLNISWEFIFGFLGEPFVSADSYFGVSTLHGPAQRFDDILWFIFDVILLYLKIKYGKDEYKLAMPYAPDNWFKIYVILQVFVSFWTVFFFVYEFNDPNGIYSAYMQNFFISLLFITQLYKRGDTKGVDMGIAVCKMLGTLAPSMLGGIVMIAYYKVPFMTCMTAVNWMPFLKMLITVCTLMDLFYIYVLWGALKKEGKSPKQLKGFWI